MFVIDLLIEIWGNDPDVKPACVYCAGRVQHGWVVPSFHTRTAPRDANEGTPLGGGPEALIDSAIAPWGRASASKQHNNKQYIYSRGENVQTRRNPSY